MVPAGIFPLTALCTGFSPLVYSNVLGEEMDGRDETLAVEMNVIRPDGPAATQAGHRELERRVCEALRGGPCGNWMLLGECELDRRVNRVPGSLESEPSLTHEPPDVHVCPAYRQRRGA